MGVPLTLQSYRGKRSGEGDPRVARSLARAAARSILLHVRIFRRFASLLLINFKSTGIDGLFFELRSNCSLFYSSFFYVPKNCNCLFWI